ncbi:uncharacterized protein A4U43_C09F10160 [Asparagus officinalis]|uniref:Uncharacterized protein n=1 Tax=Asparagus officinalis TaxID=4686 RepID=A0A5P1E721_ASPOF|nr:uncharacterized protein A4U43_C09F10160 [Asparagus officinalis]
MRLHAWIPNPQPLKFYASYLPLLIIFGLISYFFIGEVDKGSKQWRVLQWPANSRVALFHLAQGACLFPSAPMASQLKSSFISSSSRGLFVPKGLVGGSPVRSLQAKSRPSFTVKAIQAEKTTFQVVQPINGDPFIGSLETPVTSSPLIAW